MPVLAKPAVQQQMTGVIRYKSKPRPLFRLIIYFLNLLYTIKPFYEATTIVVLNFYRVTPAYLRKIQRSPLLKQALKLAMSLHLNLNETSQTLTISQKF